MKKPMIAPMKIMTRNGDCAARASVAIWLLSPSSDIRTRENIPKSVPELSHVSTVSESDLTNVKIPRIKNKNPDTYVMISTGNVVDKMKPRITAMTEDVARAIIVARSTNLGRRY